VDNVCVLMVASGAAWESAAFALLSAHRGIVVLKRCVDVDDLLAAATAGQADVAVLALDAHGLDVAAVEHLGRHRVRAVVITSLLDETAVARAARIGVADLVAETALGSLAQSVLEPGPGSSTSITTLDDESANDAGLEGTAVAGNTEQGRVVAVWGPAGAPGRTTLALALAAVAARQGTGVLLVDADPYGGAVAQHLGITDEVSGLLAAARLSASGDLESRFTAVQRRVCPGLHVITGLPRPDRWTEIRPGALEHLLEVGVTHGNVIVDTGFSLEAEPGAEFAALPGRNAMTVAALAAADEVIVVGSADPVGLSRLARGLVELKEITQGAPVRVVVNRMRPSLGWSHGDIAGMVEGFSRVLGMHFLPEDRAAVDRALITGRSLVEAGDSDLLAAVELMAPQVFTGLARRDARERRFRRRTTGRARRR
jgi:MinD-like ATPase involved in chromosome partitioning or flagellar assembly